MIAMDFCFDGLYLSDFGCIIVNFNNDNRETSGGNTEYDSVKAPGRDKFRFYGSQYNEPLSTTISIMKNPCLSDSIEDMNFNHNEERKITKWLKKTDGYKCFKYAQGNENIQNPYFSVAMGKEIGSDSDIWYQVKIDVVPHRLYDDLIGFDLTITSNCAYGFTDTITKQATINSTTPFSFEVDTDADEYIYPEKFEMSNIHTIGSFNIENKFDKERSINNNMATSFSEIGMPFLRKDLSMNDLMCQTQKTVSEFEFIRNKKIDISKTTYITNLYDYTILHFSINNSISDYPNGFNIYFSNESHGIIGSKKVDFSSFDKDKNEFYIFLDTKKYAHLSIAGENYSSSTFINLISVSTYSSDFEKTRIKYDLNTKKAIDFKLFRVTDTQFKKIILKKEIYNSKDELLHEEILEDCNLLTLQKESPEESYCVLTNLYFANPEGFKDDTSKSSSSKDDNNNTKPGSSSSSGSNTNFQITEANKDEDYKPAYFNYDLTVFETIKTDFLSLDCDNEIITGLDNPNHFNWYFPRLIDGSNEIVTDSVNDIDIEIIYREARMVAL